MIYSLGAYTLSECMETMASLIKRAEEKGEENVIFCEDRLTLIAERSLLAACGGTMSSAVYTFSRFLKAEGKILSKQGSVMAITSIMEELLGEKKLRCFKGAQSIKSGAKKIYETIAQIAASAVDAETLRAGIAELGEGTLKNKVEDIALVYEEYFDFLKKEGYLDESKYLSLLPKQIETDNRTKGKNIFFLAYGSFTAQAQEVLRSAMKVGKNVFGIFCAGEESLYTNLSSITFEKVGREFGELIVRSVGAPLFGEAERLRKALYTPEALNEKNVPMLTDKIRVFEGEDKQAEAAFVATNVKKILAENKEARYRDFAVLLPDTSSYSLILTQTFEEYGIPYFIDKKRTLKNHPLSDFILHAFDCARENSPQAADALCANVFFGNGDEYRNYLAKYANYRGGAKKPIKAAAVATGYNEHLLKKARERYLLATTIAPKGTGEYYCARVRKLLVDFSAESMIEMLTDGIADLSLKGYLEQILPSLDALLTEAETLLNKKEIAIGDFASILSDGLDASEISLIPMKNDAVFLGDIVDSRIEKVRYLFCVGLTDAVPRTGEDTALLSDRDMEKLATVKAEIEPTVAVVNLRSREWVCQNLCTFMDKLFLSYAHTEGGEDVTKSEIFRYLKVFRSSVDGKEIPVEKRIRKEDFAYLCSAPIPALRKLILSESDYVNGRTGREDYTAIRTALKQKGLLWDEKKEEKRKEKIERTSYGEELYFAGGSVSPTSLEKYFSCPFAGFLERGLKLKEREETAVLATDSGNFVHGILERTAREFSSFQSEEEVRSFARSVGEELLQSPEFSARGDTVSGSYASENLLAEGIEAAVAAYRQVVGSDFTVKATELPIKTNGYNGKIDRVDETDKFVRIIDYKTGKIDVGAEAYYTGRKLQLELYMNAIQGDKTPVGVFYFPASVNYLNEGEINFKMKGFFTGDKEAILSGDKNLSEGQESEFFDAKLEMSKNRGNVFYGEDFRYFLDYSTLVARQASEEMKRGFIAATPYEKSCDYCRFGGICGYSQEKKARKEKEVNAKEIVSLMKGIEDKGEGNE